MLYHAAIFQASDSAPYKHHHMHMPHECMGNAYMELHHWPYAWCSPGGGDHHKQTPQKLLSKRRIYIHKNYHVAVLLGQ